MGRLDGRVAIVTGAGRGIGREISLLMAREGAKVVVNDLGGNPDGSGSGKIADDVVNEIRKAGGQAAANYDSVAEMKGGEAMLKTAIDNFGGCDIVVNNAGILRDKTIFNMEEADWDIVMAVHLRGHYCCSRPFARYIRETNRRNCRIINFSSVSGLFGNFGQTNYGAAKAGIAGFSRVMALEMAKYGCTSNVISPGALTRLTIALSESRGRQITDKEIEAQGPQHIAPVVAWLATEASAGVTSQIFHVAGTNVSIMQQPALIKTFQKAAGWSLADLDRYMPELVAARKAHDARAGEESKAISV